MTSYVILFTSCIIAMIVMLGMAGWFAVTPFARVISRPALTAPLAGLVIWSSFSLLLYSGLNVAMLYAGSVALVTCITLSVWSLARNPPSFNGVSVKWIGLMIALAVLVSIFTMLPTFQLGEPAFLFKNGADHPGYAQVADWLNHHPVSVAPKHDPSKAYESWPAKMFYNDPRFGTYEVLALTAQVTGLPTLFAYDAACTTILVTACLSMAGLFGGASLALGLLLAVTMAVGQWFDLGRMGFLGKILGYPSALMVAGILVRLPDLPPTSQPRAAAYLLVLALAIAPMYAGTALAFLVGMIAVSALLARSVLQRPGVALLAGHDALTIVVTILSMAMAAGLAARPLGPSYPQTDMDWETILSLLAGLAPLEGKLSAYPFGMGHAAGWTMLLAWGGLIAVALRVRMPLAVAMLLCPVAEVAILFLIDARNFAAQLVGFTLPAVLAGAVLACDRGTARQRMLAMALTTALAIIPLPRFFQTIGNIRANIEAGQNLVSLSEMTTLFDHIGTSSVLVDVAFPQQLPILLLVHGTARPHFAWSPSAWRSIVGYRSWPAPTQIKAADYTIVRADTPVSPEAVLVRTRQFLLLGQTRDWPGMWTYPKIIVGSGANLGADYQVEGLWSDRWIAPSVTAEMSGGAASRLRIQFDIPLITDPDFQTDVQIVVNGQILHQDRIGPGAVALDLPAPAATSRHVEMRFTNGQALRLPDTRIVAARVNELALVAE